MSPTILNPRLPRDLKTICVKCLEKEPARRYQTAQELADELGRWLRGEPILARPVSRPEKVWRWCRRKPLIATLTAAAVLMFLLGFAGVTWQGQKAGKARDAAQRRLYAAEMSQAFRAWDVGNLRVAWALLDAHRPQPGAEDLRGAEWRWLWSLCQSEAKTVLPNRGEWNILVAEPSPDGRWLATAGSSTNITIHELTGKAEPRTLRGHTPTGCSQWPGHRTADGSPPVVRTARWGCGTPTRVPISFSFKATRGRSMPLCSPRTATRCSRVATTARSAAGTLRPGGKSVHP